MEIRQGTRYGKQLFLAAIACLLVTCITPGSRASGMPAYDRLQPITESLNAPVAIDVDSSGTVYVAESINRRVLIYNQSGTYERTLPGFERPISIAVDGAGRIYVGDRTDGYVAVYDSDLHFLFKLGSGDGEFVQPNDITIDSSGKIYVVDMNMALIKIYNSDGSYTGSIGGPGSGLSPTPEGKFNRPTSIEISESTGEIIVLDRGLTYDSYGTLVDGARIQKFNPDGSFRSSLVKYGMNMLIGEMFRPQHIAVDGQGRMYVTDSFYNVVLVYGDDGDVSNGSADVYLGAVYDLQSPMRIPMGIKIGRNNKTYIASLNAKRVDVFGIESYTNMAVSPLNLSYADGQCTVPLPQAVDIANSGNTVLNWTAETDENWIALSAVSGSVPVSGTYPLSIGVDDAGLAAGHYSGTVRLRAESGDTAIVGVELTAANVPFVADAGAAYDGTEGEPVMLDASSSSGCIVSYAWDIGSDGTYEYSSAFPAQEHTFPVNGVYEIMLRITGNGGSAEYAAATVRIADAVPEAQFAGGPLTGPAPLNVHFSNSSSGYDQPLTYEWDFDCDANPDSTEVSPSHTYEAGTYSVCLTVRDADGSAAALTRANYITTAEGPAGCGNLPVKMGGAYYSTLQAAYNEAAEGAVIMSRAGSLGGDLVADRDISVSLSGGYDCTHAGSSGVTTVDGAITVSRGSVHTGGFVLQ